MTESRIVSQIFGVASLLLFIWFVWCVFAIRWAELREDLKDWDHRRRFRKERKTRNHKGLHH
jgi:hypothetical protein